MADDNDDDEAPFDPSLWQKASRLLAARGLDLDPNGKLFLNGKYQRIDLKRVVTLCEEHDAIKRGEGAREAQEAEEREQERRLGMPYREICKAIDELTQAHKAQCELLREQIREHADKSPPPVVANAYQGPGLGTMLVVAIVTLYIGFKLDCVVDAVRTFLPSSPAITAPH